MKFRQGITMLLLGAVLAVPVTAQADRDKGQGNGDGECYGQKGKGKCRGGDEQRGKQHKHKQKKGHGGKHAAGGPPPWAPAHGWRRKAGGGYDDYFVDERSGAHVVVSNGTATVDVGIDRGTCNRKAIGTVVGGVVGGVIGNRVGSEENREISTIAGAVIGGIVGHNIGRTMDKSDRHCTGQALEQALDNHTVRWRDQQTNGEYRVTPKRTYEADGKECRVYITEYEAAGGVKRDKSTACRTSDGAWQKMRM